MGIEPNIWGPSTWATIHLICLGAPEVFQGEQLSYKKFFDALPYVLPCEKCKAHLIQHLESHTMDGALAGGRRTLFAWSVELHNIVNRSLGKPTMTVEDALKHWSSFVPNVARPQPARSSPKGTSKKDCLSVRTVISSLIFILIGVIISLTAIYLSKHI